MEENIIEFKKIMETLEELEIPDGYEREMIIIGNRAYSITEKMVNFLGSSKSGSCQPSCLPKQMGRHGILQLPDDTHRATTGVFHIIYRPQETIRPSKPVYFFVLSYKKRYRIAPFAMLNELRVKA